MWLLFVQYATRAHDQRLSVVLHDVLASLICWLMHCSVSRAIRWASEKQPEQTLEVNSANPESLYEAKPAAAELGTQSTAPDPLSQPAVPTESDSRPRQSTAGEEHTTSSLSEDTSKGLQANFSWLKLYTVPTQLQFSEQLHAWIR